MLRLYGIENKAGDLTHYFYAAASQVQSAWQIKEGLGEHNDLMNSFWQEHRLVFDDIPLTEALKQLDRYRVGHVFLAGEALQNLKVSGSFALDDPEAVLVSIRKALKLSATSLGSWWVILH